MDFRSTAFHPEADGTLRARRRPDAARRHQARLPQGRLRRHHVDGYGQTKAGVEATTKINRHDFGVSWNAAVEAGGMTLGDDVTIYFDLQFVLQP